MKFTLVLILCTVIYATIALPFNQDYFDNEPAQDDGNNKAVWSFFGNWNESVEGELIAGQNVEIVFDFARLPYRYGNSYGQGWSIGVGYMLNGLNEARWKTLSAPQDNGLMTQKIYLPYGTFSISVWFRSDVYFKGTHYDSNRDKNYNEYVSPPDEDIIVFDDVWGENVYGGLVKGKEFVIMYNPNRLGKNVTKVTKVGMKFSDQGDVITKQLEPAHHGYISAVVSIPYDAKKIEIWFFTEEGNKIKYDSNNSHNYKFEVESGDESVA